MNSRFLMTIAFFGCALSVLSGCREGGTFLNGIEKHMASETHQAEDLLPTLSRYEQSEKEKPRLFASGSRVFWKNNLEGWDDVSAGWDRYTAREHELRPKLSEISPRGPKGEVLIDRKFPDPDR